MRNAQNAAATTAAAAAADDTSSKGADFQQTDMQLHPPLLCYLSSCHSMSFWMCSYTHYSDRILQEDRLVVQRSSLY